MALETLDIPFGVSSHSTNHQDDEEDSGSSEESDNDLHEVDTPTYSSSDREESNRVTENTHWFVNFDASYMKPIFSRYSQSDTHTRH